MSKNWTYSWLWKSSKTRQQHCLLESVAMKTDILMNGSMVKNHISLKTGFGYPATRRTSFQSWFPGLSNSSSGSDLSTSRTLSRQGSHSSTTSSSTSSSPTVSDTKTREREDRIESDISPVTVSTTVDERSGKPDIDQASTISKTNKKEPQRERGDTLLKERRDPFYFWNPGVAAKFREISENDEIPEHGDSHASSSHEASLESTFKRHEDLCKHSVYAHFPKDRNCEICQMTKITRAPCRRRNGGAVLRADNFGDLITAGHKVLSDNCQSRNNHRYAVVVAGLGHSIDPSISVQKKKKLHRKLKEACKSSWSPIGSLKSFTRDNSLEFGKACEDLSWSHCTSTPHRSETNGVAERAVRRVKEGTSAVLLQSGLNESWWAGSKGMLHLSAKRHRSILWWEHALWKTF